MWASHDDWAIMCHPCHLVSWSLSWWTWDLRVPTLFSFNLFLYYCMLILSNCSAVPTCIPVLDPDSEANCMHPCALFASPSPSPPCGQLVKNGFSDLTKAQEGRGRPRKDVMNRCRRKALGDGCHERKEAWTVVSSREKINNNKNLARVTTKSKSKMQTVSNGHVGRGVRDKGFEEHPNIGDLIQ